MAKAQRSVKYSSDIVRFDTARHRVEERTTDRTLK